MIGKTISHKRVPDKARQVLNGNLRFGSVASGGTIGGRCSVAPKTPADGGRSGPGRWRACLILFATLVSMAGAALELGRGESAPLRTSHREPVGSSEIGIASWYGHPYHGRKAANGEKYDMNRLTAAHRLLPFGTRVRVCSLRNARIVEVRITDRGPFVEGRLIDLSRAAARVLGFQRAGLELVRLEVLCALGERNVPRI
jgi:hypothetical protein